MVCLPLGGQPTDIGLIKKGENDNAIEFKVRMQELFMGVCGTVPYCIMKIAFRFLC